MADPGKTLRVVFQDKNQGDLPLSAYGFDRHGTLIATTPVAEGGVNMNAFENAARVLLAPSTLKGSGDKAPTLASLRRAGALDIRAASKLNAIHVSTELAKQWTLCYCTVTGRVVRPVTYEGVTIEYPVCDARVHICEIDAWWWIWEMIPDLAVRAIRADLLGLEPVIVKLPPRPDPPPEFREHMMSVQHADHDHAGDSGSSFTSPTMSAPMARATAPQSEDARAVLRAAGEALPQNIRSALASPSMRVVRQTLAAGKTWLRDLIIWWPWFYYTCDDLGTVTTDHNGEFSLSFWYQCDDQPDIYIWVEFFIGGVWQTVYAPSRATDTIWDYTCGSDITIRITDERVPYCNNAPPVTGRKVIITTIGNGVNASTIQRMSAGVDHGLTDAGQPFGGSLEPHVDFGTGLQVPTNATPPQFYYRWSYRRLGSSGLFTVIDRPVYRRYRVELTNGDIEYRSLQIGPVSGMPTTMFMVPPMDPFDADPNVVVSQWVTLNAREDSASAFFRSDLLDSGDPFTSAGKYELIFELFDNAGILITDWSPSGANIEGRLVDPYIPAPFQPVTLLTVPVTGVLSTSLWYENDYGPADGLPSRGMRVVLHVDNNPCTASIYTLTGTNLVSDTLCGFYVYTNPAAVDISFIARHPNRFANFTFYTFRGASIGVPSASFSARVGVTSGFWSYIAGPSRYSKPVDVTTLLTENQPLTQLVACTKAAFAETLYVAAMAVDGWSRLSNLDASGTPKAFALSDV